MCSLCSVVCYLSFDFFYYHRRSGQSIFSRPKPIDLSAARRFNLDVEEEEDEEDAELGRPLVRNSVLFDAGAEQTRSGQYKVDPTDMPRAVQAARDRDAEDVWAELG